MYSEGPGLGGIFKEEDRTGRLFRPGRGGTRVSPPPKAVISQRALCGFVGTAVDGRTTKSSLG